MDTLLDDDEDGEKEVFNLLRKSLRLAGDSITGAYYMGNFFERKNDLKKAREYYQKIINEHPEFAFLIIPHFEKVSFELGSFNDIIPIYEKISAKYPKNFSVGFALANLYEKKNDLEAAEDVYLKLSELFPRSVLPKIRLLKLKTVDETTLSALDEIETALWRREFICRSCENMRAEFSFLCEKCHAIESFSPVL